MQTEILVIAPGDPADRSIQRAAEILRDGGLVAFPTETVYGLGANALDVDAVARIFHAKGRPSNNPVIVHVPEADAARNLVTDWPPAAAQLAAMFWPGPLTLILPRSGVVPDIVTAGGPTVALRVPNHPVALALLRAVGIPIAAPSANRSMRLSPTRAEHVAAGLSGRIEMILDGGPTSGGLESTVLDLSAATPRLLRPGLIAPAQIEAVIGPIARLPAMPPSEEALPSPGMMLRHYAPRAPLEIADDNGRQRIGALLSQGVRVGWISSDAGVNEVSAPGLTALRLPADPPGYAAQIYASLHSLDQSGVERIVISHLPDGEEWLAVRDRLRRAAQPQQENR